MPAAKPVLSRRTGRRLTENQQHVLDFIRRWADRTGVFPSHAEIAKHMGWGAKQSAVDCLRRLERHGIVREVGYCGNTGRIVWELVE